MNLRTVLITETVHPPLTGIGRYAWELAAGLIHHHDDVDLRLLAVGRWLTMDNLCEQVRAAQQGQSSTASVQRPGTSQHFKSALKAWLGKQPSVGRAYEASRSLLNRRAVQKLPADMPTVIHGPDYFAPSSEWPTVVTIHDLSVLLYPETQPATRVSRFKRLIQRADQAKFTILTDAQSVADELVAHTGISRERTFPVHLGVSSHFRMMPSNEIAGVQKLYGLQHDGYVLSVGTAEPRKNLVRLLAAYEALPQRLRTHFPLVLAGGRGWNDDALLQRIQRARAAGWVRALGYVPEAHLPALYSGARLFAYVSLYEGFGLPVAEAMACGTPVLTSNCSSMPEVAAGAALLANPLDVQDIHMGLQCSLEDDAWRLEARQRGLARAAELTWDRTVASTLAVYRKMVAA